MLMPRRLAAHNLDAAYTPYPHFILSFWLYIRVPSQFSILSDTATPHRTVPVPSEDSAATLDWPTSSEYQLLSTCLGTVGKRTKETRTALDTTLRMDDSRNTSTTTLPFYFTDCAALVSFFFHIESFNGFPLLLFFYYSLLAVFLFFFGNNLWKLRLLLL